MITYMIAKQNYIYIYRTINVNYIYIITLYYLDCYTNQNRNIKLNKLN